MAQLIVNEQFIVDVDEDDVVNGDHDNVYEETWANVSNPDRYWVNTTWRLVDDNGQVLADG